MTPLNIHVGVIGLGYVGLQLATAFGRLMPTVGFDVDSERIEELRGGRDRNGEVSGDALRAPNLSFTTDPSSLCTSDFIIVSVPTPVDDARRPDLAHLVEASRMVGGLLKRKALSNGSEGGARRGNAGSRPVVVYESTVYPGCTEEVCVPLLEEESGLNAGQHFTVGYSPERMNPGDSENSFSGVVKVVAAADKVTLSALSRLYGLVVDAGVYEAPDIRTAEAAKVIENVQRDLNIALMNELSMLFNRMGLNTREVLKAARTKWNFLAFQPGLVGGHCIPVDPYYLTHKAQQVGYHPEMILAGRRVNDNMGAYVAQETTKLMTRAGKAVKNARVLVLGVAFKENVRDVRNSQVIELVRELRTYEAAVEVYDPLVDEDTLKALDLRPAPDNPIAGGQAATSGRYDAVILAVPHNRFRAMSPDIYLGLLKEGEGPGVVVDVMGVLPDEWIKEHRERLLYWTL